MPSVHEQQREALTVANGVRMARAELRRRVHDGEISLIDLLRDPPDLIKSAPLFKVMRWEAGLAEKRIIRLCHGVISPTIAIGHISETTRQRIIGRLETREYKRYKHHENGPVVKPESNGRVH